MSGSILRGVTAGIVLAIWCDVVRANDISVTSAVLVAYVVGMVHAMIARAAA